MPTFQSKKFYGSGDMGKVGVRYRALLEKRPFLAFGLPFLAIIVAGSFALTPSTAVRYERQDRKVRQLSREEQLSLGREKRKVDMREEYYRLAAKDIDNWEQRRVKRLPGEHDGLL